MQQARLFQTSPLFPWPRFRNDPLRLLSCEKTASGPASPPSLPRTATGEEVCEGWRQPLACAPGSGEARASRHDALRPCGGHYVHIPRQPGDHRCRVAEEDVST